MAPSFQIFSLIVRLSRSPLQKSKTFINPGIHPTCCLPDYGVPCFLNVCLFNLKHFSVPEITKSNFLEKLKAHLRKTT